MQENGLLEMSKHQLTDNQWMDRNGAQASRVPAQVELLRWESDGGGY